MKRQYYVAIPDDRNSASITVSLALSPTVSPELPNYTFSSPYATQKQAEDYKKRIALHRNFKRQPVFQMVGAN